MAGPADIAAWWTKAPSFPARPGYYQCNACRKQFTVMVGTVFERSHIPLNKWLMAAFLLCASKKGISAHQMHRMLGITYKIGLVHDAPPARGHGPAGKPGPMGGEGKVIEADETYLGKRDGKPSKPDTFVSGFGWVSHPKIETQRKIVAAIENSHNCSLPRYGYARSLDRALHRAWPAI